MLYITLFLFSNYWF